jgi:hypothetical protein
LTKNKTAIVIYVIPLFFYCLFFFGSCATKAAPGENQPFAYLTDNSKYFLLPPNGIEKPMDMAQRISASFGGRDYFFNVWVKADETGMEMTLFNELGAGMGELSYGNGVVHFSSSVLPGYVKPEYIVADFQLCFYEPSLLRQALKKCGLAFEIQGEPGNGIDGVRRVLKGKNLILEIETVNNVVRLVNHLRGYSYLLEGNFE